VLLESDDFWAISYWVGCMSSSTGVLLCRKKYLADLSGFILLVLLKRLSLDHMILPDVIGKELCTLIYVHPINS